jgi:sigma-E factor negative regulatory protein RseB
MSDVATTHKAAACLALCGFFTAAGAYAGEDLAPHEWLNRMSGAVQTTDYEGTVIRVRDGRVEAFKVVHAVSDGVVREKVIIQDGDGLEIIRNGNEVLCIFPDRESVLVEEWNNQSTLFSTLPSSEIRSGGVYDVLIKGYDRIAARKSVQLAVVPHDEYRYGYRVWLDVETGFPLQTWMIGSDNERLQQVRFTEIRIHSEILASELSSSYVTDNWKWTDVSHRRAKKVIDTDWSGDDIPPGFRVISTSQEALPGGEEEVTHIRYGDGLATVSVFISSGGDGKKAKRSRVDASNSYSTVIDGYRVTAVGEVPEITVEQIAKSMRRRQ